MRLSRLLTLIAGLIVPNTGHPAGTKKSDGLSQKEIVAVIEQHNDDARDCYQAALEKDKNAAGKVKIRFLIGLKGKIEAMESEQNTFKDKSIYSCLKQKMNSWVFPKPRGDQRISIAYPFEFKTSPAPKQGEAGSQTPAASPLPAPPLTAQPIEAAQLPALESEKTPPIQE